MNDGHGPNLKKTKPIVAPMAEIVSKMGVLFKRPVVREGMLFTICFFLLILLLHWDLSPRYYDLKVGQVSKDDIRAPQDVVDPEATRQAQAKAVNQALEAAKQDIQYYMIDESVGVSVKVNLNRFFEMIEPARQVNALKKGNSFSVKDLPMTAISGCFRKMPSVNLIQSIISMQDDRYREFKEKAHQVLSDLELNQKLTANQIETIDSLLSTYLNLHQITPELSPVLFETLKVTVRPNLIPDRAKLDRLQQQIEAELPPVMHRQKEIIISKNQVITENDIAMLKDLHLDKSNGIRVFFSLSSVVLLLFGLIWIYIIQFHSELLKEERLLYLLVILGLLVVGLIKILSLVDKTTIPYLAPVGFGAMLISILINPLLALAMTIVISLLGGIIVEFNLTLTIFYFVSGVTAVFTLSRFHRQRDLVRSGFILMVVNGLTAIILNLLSHATFNFTIVLLATINGFLSSVLAIGSIPFLEHIFRITSPIRLLELANPGNPLLRRLQIEAPGTYHHSIMVGNLAEAAAEGIGADALWVRVGSYYHDIGKIKRPYFFVENQFAQENPHEKLNPSLSTLIITYHVKEGAEIARQHGLPEKLIQIIEQHHGTDLVRYFYRRASENAQGEKEVISEEDFRYEGPKPQTKEAALVMLADSVEAAVKAMSKPTPAKVESLVHKIIHERLEDGQFDECNLTLKDLDLVKKSFIKVLGGLFHNRIEYPDTVLNEIERKKANADSSK